MQFLTTAAQASNTRPAKATAFILLFKMGRNARFKCKAAELWLPNEAALQQSRMHGSLCKVDYSIQLQAETLRLSIEQLERSLIVTCYLT